jgi:cathepsin A (carboxypeptidase C)
MNRHKEKIRQSILEHPYYQKLAQRSVNTNQNTFSTDNQGGFPCFASAAAQNWLNSNDVRKALHIPNYVQNWTECNDYINEVYIQQYNTTDAVFDDIINSGYPLRILVYNGDVDLVCNFIGDQWFIEKVAKRHDLAVESPHQPWHFRNGGIIAGYVKVSLDFFNQT